MERPNSPFERNESETELEQSLRELPPPEHAGGILTALLSDQARDSVLNAQGEGTEIDSYTARSIAYNLTAHAPAEAATTNLRHFYATGEGSHEELRAEYLPLRLDPSIPAEGQLLIDALGTHLINRDQPERVTRKLAHATFVILKGDDGTRQGLLFKSDREMGKLGIPLQVMRLSRIADEAGDAFWAYLRVPGVDAAEPDIAERFRTNYIGGHNEATTLQAAPDTSEPIATHEVEIGGQTYVFHA